MLRLKNLDAVTCRPNEPVKVALARLTSCGHLFQLIVDETGRLLGTLTDADVRRAILRGSTIDSTVSECMQTQPMTGRFGREEENLDKWHRIPGLVTFLPILDDSGRVHEVLIAEQVPNEIHALVMAGGQGRRLGALTENTPKPLLAVGEKPILDHILTRLEDHGIRSIFISIHHLADKIESFVTARNNRAQIEFVYEAEPLGTAGALAKLPRDQEGEILVINGDVIAQADFGALETFHHRHGHDATITVTSYEVQVPYGVVLQNEDGGFRGIDEKPEKRFFVAAGIYLLSPQFCALVPDDEPIDMPDLLNRGRSLGLRVGLFPVHEYWRDIGRPSDLASANHEHQVRFDDAG